MRSAKEKKRFSELDALRGIAALGVVLFHYTFGYDYAFQTITSGKFYFRYGHLGVNLFFIISGFVIFMTLEKTKSTTSFVVSRFSRLYPAYWAGIILTVLLAAPIQKDLFSARQVLVNFTMLQSFFKVSNVDGAYWTLAVELTFYCWMWFMFKTKKSQYIEWLCLVWLVAAVAVTAFTFGLRKYLLVIGIFNHSPVFIAGILFYLLKKRGSGLWLHALIVMSLLVELYMLYAFPAVINRDGIFDSVPYIIIIAFYGTFYLFAFNGLAMLSNKIFIFFGGISYSLYLIHQNIGEGIIYWLKQVLDKQVFYLPVTMAIVILLAFLINRYIEKPAMKKIRGFYAPKELSPAKLVIAKETVA